MMLVLCVSSGSFLALACVAPAMASRTSPRQAFPSQGLAIAGSRDDEPTRHSKMSQPILPPRVPGSLLRNRQLLQLLLLLLLLMLLMLMLLMLRR